MKKLIPIFILSLFAFVACSDDDDKSIALSDSVVEFIKSKYNGADIRHAEYDGNGLIEVEILHDTVEYTKLEPTCGTDGVHATYCTLCQSVVEESDGATFENSL